MERELNGAQARVEGAQATFDAIAARMASELARFQVPCVAHQRPVAPCTAPSICAAGMSSPGGPAEAHPCVAGGKLSWRPFCLAQAERAEEMAGVLREFAAAQARAAMETSAVWQTLVPPEAGPSEGQ